MPDKDERSISRLVDVIKGGGGGTDLDQAVNDLWECYFKKLVALATNRLRNLNGGCGSLNSPEDVALSAFHSFCKRASEGRFETLHDRDDLWKLLVTLTVSKAAREYRRKYVSAVSDDILIHVIGKEPTPELAAAVAEAVKRLLDALKSEHQTIAVKKLEGHTNKEIADIIGCSVKNIEYKLKHIRATWHPLLNDETMED